MKKYLLPFLLIGFLASYSTSGQTSGCCTKTTITTCSYADVNDICTGTPVISYNTGINSGTGDCIIPAGAIIKTCRVTLSAPLVDGTTNELTHINATIMSGTAGATNVMEDLDPAWTVNFDALGGVPVAGVTFSVRFTGNSNCSPRDNHQVSLNISVALCWQVPQQIFYQSATGLQGTYLGNCMENLNCSSTLPYVFADNGTQASGGLYSAGINNIYRTFCPNTIGKCISANVEYYELETLFDYLRALNGPTQNSPALANLTGSKPWGSPSTYTSSDSSGCLSFRFLSYFNRGGFYVTLNCVNCAVADNLSLSDCEGAINACGSTSYGGSSNGPGLKSSCDGCVISENYTTWYYFEIATAGTLAITIDPVDNHDDYDFALFQSNDCNNLGLPVRCSYAALTIDGNTGMADGYRDQSETATGDGWVRDLAVSSAQNYYLMVNNWSPGDAGYNLYFYLTDGTFKECLPLPVALTGFKGTCNQGHSELTWSTVSETNNDYWAVMKSTDNTVFKTSGYVMGAGNSNEVRKYYYKDPEENNGTVYYKLKQVDFNGSATYSELLSLNCGSSDPADLVVKNFQDQGYINLSFSAKTGEKYIVTLTGSEGKIIYRLEYESPRQQASIDIPVSALKAGIYRACVQSETTMLKQNVFIY